VIDLLSNVAMYLALSYHNLWTPASNNNATDTKTDKLRTHFNGLVAFFEINLKLKWQSIIRFCYRHKKLCFIVLQSTPFRSSMASTYERGS
jgi:hypothetical protein